MDKYNYVVLGSEWDLYRFSYSDLCKLDNVKYIAGMFPPRNSVRGILYRLHFDVSINRIVRLPFKQIWYGSYFDSSFQKERPLCFVLFTNWLQQNPGLVAYLRKHYPEAKLVCFLQDLIRTKQLRSSDQVLDGHAIKSQFDLTMSFDQGDCETYGFVYHPLVFSSYHGIVKDMPHSDVYMLARAKNRLSDILSVYEVLRDNGLKVSMMLSDVERSQQKYADEIAYINGQSVNYEDNLQQILHTNCILEVMQKNGSGFTQRGVEAVCLGKRLLTNNPCIKEAPFYNPDYISTFTSADDINPEFLKTIKGNNCGNVDYHYKERLSPIELLDFIEARL